MAAIRQVSKIIKARLTSDGAGVSLYRSIGTHDLSDLDPFLLLDEFGSSNPDDYIAGFPPHPHRGFETVTYMVEGHFKHEDSAGHSGELKSGGVQWMTAGRGVIHSEMPLMEEGRLHGFQLWVNLPAKKKMCAPRYQNIGPEQIPEISPSRNVSVKVIAGMALGVKGPVEGIYVDPMYLDVTMGPGESWTCPVASGKTVFSYIYEGTAIFDQRLAGRGSLVVLTEGDEIAVAAGDHGARMITLAGDPISEPIARYGPFVMNTAEEISRAIADYRSGAMGSA
ncbi:MAG: pirin family protein [Nitrospinae bacterium]|nr:pirin family protein [Nitrospinota bacterium]